MYCPRCGTPASPQDKFCKECGQAFPQQPQTRGPRVEVESAAPKRSKAVIPLAIVAAVLLVAIICVGVFIIRGGTPQDNNGGANSGGTSQVEGGVAKDDKTGEQIQALARPQIMPASTLQATESITPNVPSYNIQKGLSNVSYVDNFYLQDEAKAKLEKYGFVVNGGGRGYDEFYEIYENNRYNLLPNFVTVDSLMHTYHLYFQHLQKNAELGGLATNIAQMSQDLLSKSEEQLKELKGTEWEEAAKRNVAFFAVGASLQDPNTKVPSEVQSIVKDELSHIEAAQGLQKSDITGSDEDYSQYIVRGYYEGNETLERYFRTMMWYGRMNFKQKEEDLDRSALLMTLALEGDALDRWTSVYTVTSFFAGASDDCGYYEYKPLIDAAYGEGASASDLAGNDEAWQHFHNLTATMEAPQINSVPLSAGVDGNESRTDEEKGFRLMGQRFSLDAMIFTRLLYPEVGQNSQGKGRTMPDALDVPAALGSDEALSILEDRGDTGYDGYSDNMKLLREELDDETDPRWSASLYSQWLYTLNPLLSAKGEGYPTFMQSSQWTRKSLQSYLGSFTELKHDTVLYSKQVMAEMGGEPIEEKDDRGYVEPEPEVFKRLSNLTAATIDGLRGYDMLPSADEQNLQLLQTLAKDLSEIARKELTGEAVTDDEYDLIRTYGGQLEHFWQEVYKDEAENDYFTSREFPAAVVVDVATDGDNGTVLELGTGRASNLYVVVEVEGKLKVAAGSTFSFYQFEQPMNDRLTDKKWRQMLGIEMGDDGKWASNTIPTEDWTNDFSVQ